MIRTVSRTARTVAASIGAAVVGRPLLRQGDGGGRALEFDGLDDDEEEGEQQLQQQLHGDAMLDAAVAAAEEADHLAWSERRIQELGGNTSALNPVWYAGSFAMGFLAGKAGDRWNLAFLEETERQVEEHLQGHLERLHPRDVKTREVIAAMKMDEARHGQMAHELGARELPDLIKKMMRGASRVMTRASYYV